MQNFVNFLKENYSYFVFAIEFLLALVGSFFAFVKKRSCDRLKDQLSCERDFSELLRCYQDAYFRLPDLIYTANILYPIHGDGKKRFDYVYNNFLKISGFDDTDHLREEVLYYVRGILNADKLEKISRDTQDYEPKKEFSYEKKEDDTIEGSQDLCQDGEENQIVERSARYVPRRD